MTRARGDVKSIGHLAASLERKAARAYHRGRSFVDALLHPSRHRHAVARLRGAPRPRVILVVCHGNLCRSPYMQAALARLLPDVEVTSAGIFGPGRAVPDHGITTAARRGLDLQMHRSRLLTRDIVSRADLVVTMDAEQERYVSRAFACPPDRIVLAADLDPYAGEGRVIRDPWRQGVDVFERTYARLDRCAAMLAQLLPRATARV